MKKIYFILVCVLINAGAFSQNQNISNEYVFDGEPFLAVNPNNSQHQVVAWMGYRMFNYIVIKTRVSFDGGQNWSSTNSIPHTNPVFGSADPSLAFDNSGQIYLCYIDYDVGVDSGFIYVRKSTDGGLNWGDPVEVINAHSDPGKYPIDRPWITIDCSGGVYDGYIYVTSMPPNVFGPLNPPYHPYFMRSIDGGSTFEPWKYLDTDGWLAGSIIPQPTPFSTTSGGMLYCVYPSWVLLQNIDPQFILASSANGGSSFEYSTLLSNPLKHTFNDTLAKKGFPLIANPANPDHIVFLNLMEIYGDADVFMTESFNGGLSWSDPIRVNDDPVGNNRMQDLIWADFDKDGDLIVTWRDRRNASDSTYTVSSEIWAAFRSKDSSHFTNNFLISDVSVPYDTILARSGNDFMCVKLVNDTINAVWGDVRNGYLNIWYSKRETDGTPVSLERIAHERTETLQLIPNPTTGLVQINNVDDINDYELFIYDSSGQLVYETRNNDIIDISFLSSGTYYCKLTTGDTQMSGKIIKIE